MNFSSNSNSLDHSSTSHLMEEKYLRCHLKSLKLIETSDFEKAAKQLEGLYQINFKPSKYEILTLNNLSLVYAKQKQMRKAYITLDQAVTKSKLQGYSKELLGSLINMSAIASLSNSHLEAMNYALQAKQLLCLDPSLTVLVNYNLALEYIYLSRFEDAENLLKQTCSQLTDQCSSTLSQSVLSAYSHLISLKQHYELKQSKSTNEVNSRKIVLKKNISLGEETKRTAKPDRTLKRCDSQNVASSRASQTKASKLAPKKRREKPCISNTSSTESVKSISSCLKGSSARSIKKLLNTDKAKNASPVYKKEQNIGGVIQNIGIHLNSIEKKLNDYVELCKPLVSLVEDPDEQLESQRLKKSDFSEVFNKRNQAAVKIQRAWRRFRNEKIMKRSFFKFKENNPLFKASSSSFKGLMKNVNRCN